MFLSFLKHLTSDPSFPSTLSHSSQLSVYCNGWKKRGVN
uniref:Uncharacterized protein n=1 Tax=Anguilla anguilla TaxID=7936 RepID=A0A0E9SIP8_ANGAN